jgi:two-component system sensor histidine kinase TctE
MTPKAGPKEVRLFAYVGLGAVAGIIYVVFDMLSESRLESGTLTGGLAQAHEFIDHTSPIVVGALLGVCAHYLRLRSQLAAAQEAAARAEALRTRLLDELSACAGDEARRADLVGRARAQADRALGHLQTLRAMRGLGEPELQRIALDRVIAAVAHDVGSLAAEDGLVVRTECSGPVQASADPGYVRTIVENLVDNSLHALRAGGGGCVTIRVGSEDGRAIVRVFDDGPPVDPAARATLFEPLRSTKTHGLGLGLPIARALARAMRGDLSLEEADLKAFRLELPLRGAP